MVVEMQKAGGTLAYHYWGSVVSWDAFCTLRVRGIMVEKECRLPNWLKT
jgi:hypothetical protein